MVNFNEQQIIANGDRIYTQREKIEAIADSIADSGFDLLLFTSSGGSQAMFFKINTWGEEAFLEKVRNVAETL